MPSNYQSFEITKRDADGRVIPVAGATVKVFNATNNTPLPDLTTDLNGQIPGGSLNVPAGTRIIFRVENFQGLAGSISQITI